MNRPITLRVYRNLHRKCYSVQAKLEGRWKVIGYADEIVLKNVNFKVYEAGRQSTIKKRSKVVHAYAIGEISSEDFCLDEAKQVKYNPYIKDHFFLEDTGEEIRSADFAYLNQDGVFI